MPGLRCRRGAIPSIGFLPHSPADTPGSSLISNASLGARSSARVWSAMCRTARHRGPQDLRDGWKQAFEISFARRCPMDVVPRFAWEIVDRREVSKGQHPGVEFKLVHEVCFVALCVCVPDSAQCRSTLAKFGRIRPHLAELGRNLINADRKWPMLAHIRPQVVRVDLAQIGPNFGQLWPNSIDVRLTPAILAKLVSGIVVANEPQLSGT